MEVGVIDTLHFSKGASFSNLFPPARPTRPSKRDRMAWEEREQRVPLWQGKVTFQNSNRCAEPDQPFLFGDDHNNLGCHPDLVAFALSFRPDLAPLPF